MPTFFEIKPLESPYFTGSGTHLVEREPYLYTIANNAYAAYANRKKYFEYRWPENSALRYFVFVPFGKARRKRRTGAKASPGAGAYCRTGAKASPRAGACCRMGAKAPPEAGSCCRTGAKAPPEAGVYCRTGTTTGKILAKADFSSTLIINRAKAH